MTAPEAGTPLALVSGALRRHERALLAGGSPWAGFAATYRRTTEAVDRALGTDLFEDPAWVAEWDAAFALFYLDALGGIRSGGPVSRPWRLALGAPAELPALRHVLLGMNAHINYDLPQALLAVIPAAEFADPALLAARRRDHERIDEILLSRVAAEDAALGGARSLLDRLLVPANRAATGRFLREARRKVWHNTRELHTARVNGASVYAARLAELEALAAARVQDLLAPGPVVLRLAVHGFGVQLPPGRPGRPGDARGRPATRTSWASTPLPL